MRWSTVIFFGACYFNLFYAGAQSVKPDTIGSKDLEEVVITATRTERKLGNVAVPRHPHQQKNYP